MLDDFQVVGDLGNGGLHITTTFVAFPFETAAWNENTTPLFDNCVEGALVLRHSIGVDQRSDVVVFVKRITNADLLVRLRQLIAHLVVNAVVDDQASRRRAPLTACAHGTKHSRGNDHFQVGLRSDDDGVVAAQFKQGTSEACRHGLGHNLAHPDGTSGRHERNAAVGGHHLSHLVVSVDDAAGAGWKVVGLGHFVPNVLARDGTERRLFRGLPNTHVSRNPREGGVPTPHSNREVECADDAHHPEGVILFVHPVVGTLRVHGEAIQLAALAHSEITDVDHLLHLTKSFLVALAHFIGHKGA